MDMIGENLQERITAWTERLIGVPLSALGGHPMPALTPDPEAEWMHPLVAIRCGDASALVATEEICDAVRPIMPNLHTDLVFAPFGIYELSRVTLPLGIAVWGPSFYLFGDRETVDPNVDERVVKIGAEELANVDFDIFWHCQREALAGFAVYEGDDLAALATVTDHGEPVWEIGMETHPNAQARGLGRAVVNAAANWILENDRIVLATVGTFNIPSARTLRSVGLRYAYMTIDGKPGPFMVQPQPLGSPRAGETLYQYYPDWATTKGILPRPK